MLTMFKRPASLVPTPATNKVTLFVSDTGIPSYKDDAGLVTPMSGQPIPAGYIDGLKMEWVSGTQMRFTSGSAYIPSLGRALALAAAVTKSPSLAASTWYHAYLYSNAGTPDVEVTTTAPDTPYSGAARAKTGDTSRRYIGSFRTMASGAIAKFTHDLASAAINYLEDLNATPFAVVAGGTATTPTTVACSAIVPVTSKRVKFLANNNATNQFVYMSNSEAVNTLSASNWMSLIAIGSSFYAEFPLDSSQNFNYMYGGAPAGGQVFIRAVGYVYER
ncbi:hypothetical protein [Stenotrophomonas maltophilia]|uniref:hypothetical protein n=1 Tax=Stenotrophomonas maltophilia TaxID=40324 RepID=UPI0013D9B958|nr:hypothetical protein [Stenotrophomonas maltophilia]